MKVATIELLWTLNLWRAEFFRTFTTRIPTVVFLWYCKTWVPFLHYLNKVPVVRYLRYIFPSTCYADLPVEWSMLDTFDTYAIKIVHKYRAKDLFQWFLKRGLKEIILQNSRAGWVSITAVKGDDKDLKIRSKELSQPKGPGLTGEYN